MKRRIFALGMPAVAVMALAGCKSKPGDELIGHWIKHRQNGRIEAMIRIQREGDVLTKTVAEFGFFAREGHPPKETTTPLVYSRDLGQHGVQSPFGFVPVQRIGEELAFLDERFARSTPEQYAEWMSTVLPPARRF